MGLDQTNQSLSLTLAQTDLLILLLPHPPSRRGCWKDLK